MSGIGAEFRTWLLEQQLAGCTPRQLDDDHIAIEGPEATAQVNFYPYEEKGEIVEYLIVRTSDGEPVFFLHFMLDDMARAEELFEQMAEAFADEAEHAVTKVLLSCTSAMTTSMFAAKMNEVSQALSLGYEFEAKPIDAALKCGRKGGYAAVLLAPQAAFVREKMVKAHPQAVVFEIPAKIFGSYDAPAAVRLLMHALRDLRESSTGTNNLKAVRDVDDDRRVLIITLFTLREYSRLGYKLYEHGVVTKSGAVRKPKLDFRDIEDLLETMSARGIEVSELDAVGLAVPGVTCRGTVTLPDLIDHSYDLGKVLARRFGVPVYVDNNCNAAAVGCYVSQDEYESLIFMRQEFGHIAGGFGTVIDGKLLKGRGNLAGEPKYFQSSFYYPKGYENAIWSAEGLREIAEHIALAAISLISPEAVFLAFDTVDDADEFHARLAETLTEEYTPPIVIVNDYVERVYLGELAMVLQKLRDPYYRSLGVGVWHDIPPRGTF